MLTQTQIDKFKELSNRLSPEWLTCDGELSTSQVIARRNQIMKEWRALQKEIGVEVDPDDVEMGVFQEYDGREVSWISKANREIAALQSKAPKAEPAAPVEKPVRWKRFKEEILPEGAKKLFEKFNENAGVPLTSWCEAWYKGNGENAEDWFIVSGDGGFYKVGAQYISMWVAPTGYFRSMCSWSIGHVYKMRKAVQKNEEPVRDTNYQT